MSRIPPIEKIPRFDILWQGSKTQSGNISLSKGTSNYDFLIIYTMTNIEYFADISPTNSMITIHHEAGTSGQYGTQYASHINLTIAPNNVDNMITINGVGYNNVNWQLGVYKVIGVKISQ